MSKYLKINLLTALFAGGALLASGPASAQPVLCSTINTLQGFISAASNAEPGCSDADGDMVFTYDAGTSSLTNLDATTTQFAQNETESGGVDFYGVDFSFPSSYAGGDTIEYSMDRLNSTKLISSAGLQTTALGLSAAGASTSVQELLSSGGNSIISFTSANGSPDPATGETSFLGQTGINVENVIATSTGGAVYTSLTNNFNATVPEPGTVFLMGAGLLGLAGARRGIRWRLTPQAAA